jgi:hypothetical protein
MSLLRLLLMIALAFAGDVVSSPLVPEAFAVEDADEAAHRAPRRPRVASVRRETSGPAVAQQVAVRRVVVDRRPAAHSERRSRSSEHRKVPSAVPEPVSPEAH